MKCNPLKHKQRAHRWVRCLVKASAVLALVGVGFGCETSDQTELASPSNGAGDSTTSDGKKDDLDPGPSEQSTPCDQSTDIVSAGRVTQSNKYKLVFSFGPSKDLPGSKKSALYQQGDLGCGNTVDDVK